MVFKAEKGALATQRQQISSTRILFRGNTCHPKIYDAHNIPSVNHSSFRGPPSTMDVLHRMMPVCMFFRLLPHSRERSAHAVGNQSPCPIMISSAPRPEKAGLARYSEISWPRFRQIHHPGPPAVMRPRRRRWKQVGIGRPWWRYLRRLERTRVQVFRETARRSTASSPETVTTSSRTERSRISGTKRSGYPRYLVFSRFPSSAGSPQVDRYDFRAGGGVARMSFPRS